MDSRQKNNCKQVSRLLKVLAHPTRLEIVCVLREGRQCVNDICGYLEKKQSNISQHLSLLRNAGFIDLERVGNSSRYFLTNKKVVSVLQTLSEEA